MTGALTSEGSKAAAAEDKAAKEVEVTLEEDDLFEEFGKVEGEAEGEAARLWAPEWEDEELGDDFAKRLKAELARN